MKLQCLIAIFLLSLIELFSFFDLFLYDRIYDSDSRQVQDVTRRTFHVGAVDRTGLFNAIWIGPIVSMMPSVSSNL